MAGVILGRVLALAKRLVCRWLENLCAVLLGLLKMSIHIVDGYMDVLVDPLTGRLEGSSPSTQHERTIADRELRMRNRAVRSWRSQPLNESKGSAKPGDGLTHIVVDQDGDNRRSRR
jgi:hypothetical protein